MAFEAVVVTSQVTSIGTRSETPFHHDELAVRLGSRVKAAYCVRPTTAQPSRPRCSPSEATGTRATIVR